MTNISSQRYMHIIDEICTLRWTSLNCEQLLSVAWAYYFFSVQFRESLEVACEMLPGDERLILLREGECDTDNLSPFPGIAASGERMNHDEFVKRLIDQADFSAETAARLEALGAAYLEFSRGAEPMARAQSIASYEDGGLERVFKAILTAQDWGHPSLCAFHHFLVEHIRFDSDPDGGHGALSRHLVPDDRILPLWVAFLDLLVESTPELLNEQPAEAAEQAVC